MASKTLYVPPINPEQFVNTPMRISSMPPEEIKALENGNTVQVLVAFGNQKARKIYTHKKMPLKALTVISPVINAAVKENNKTTDAYIHRVILPSGSIEAYKLLFDWVWDMIAEGKVTRLARINDLPLIRYDGIQHIATLLGINYLKVGMIRRIGSMLSQAEKRSFRINIEEIAIIFTTQDDDHPLQKAIVDALKKSTVNGTINPQFRDGLCALAVRIPRLYRELFGGSGMMQQAHLGFDMADMCVDDRSDCSNVIQGIVYDAGEESA